MTLLYLIYIWICRVTSWQWNTDWLMNESISYYKVFVIQNKMIDENVWVMTLEYHKANTWLYYNLVKAFEWNFNIHKKEREG